MIVPNSLWARNLYVAHHPPHLVSHRTASNVRYITTHIFLAAYDQRRPDHDWHMWELQRKRKSVPPGATDRGFISIGTPQFYCYEYTMTIAKINPKSLIHLRYNGSILRTNTSYPYVQNLISAHDKHLPRPPDGPVQYPHVFLDGKWAVVRTQILYARLRILRR